MNLSAPLTELLMSCGQNFIKASSDGNPTPFWWSCQDEWIGTVDLISPFNSLNCWQVLTGQQSCIVFGHRRKNSFVRRVWWEHRQSSAVLEDSEGDSFSSLCLNMSDIRAITYLQCIVPLEVLERLPLQSEHSTKCADGIEVQFLKTYNSE